MGRRGWSVGVDDKTQRALTGLAQWLECQPMQKESCVQLPVKSMYLSCRLDPSPRSGCVQEATK